MNDHDVLLRDTIARHFPAATTNEHRVDLGVGDLAIDCRVDNVNEGPGFVAAALFFQLRGGALGSYPVFASISGYGPTAEQAITTGACNWACSFGPVLRAGLTDEAMPDVASFEIELDGQEFDVFIDTIDRTMGFEEGLDLGAIGKACRARFAPEGWLTKVIAESGAMPMISTTRPTILSVFASDGPSGRVFELKIDGADWPHASAAFAHVDFEQGDAITLMRELAVVVPASRPPPLSHDAILVTLGGISDPTIRHDEAHWPGWRHHRGVLADPLDADELAEIESFTGELPADYRAFLLDIGASGAGPGYGLLAPLSSASVGMIEGELTWEHETEANGPPQGVIALAHAGCGVMWLLVLRGPHRGEVWLDANSSDGKVRRVASSFSVWYRDWLAAAVRNEPFVQWNAGACATPNLFSQLANNLTEKGVADADIPDELVKMINPGAVALAAAGSRYFGDKHNLHPCYGCVSIAGNLGLSPDIFAAGEEPVNWPGSE